MRKRLPKGALTLGFTMLCCTLLITLAIVIRLVDHSSPTQHFTENTLRLTNGWQLTRDGKTEPVSLPATLDLGPHSTCTLELTLPTMNMALKTPVLRLYSNYFDVDIYLDGVLLQSFPSEEPALSAGTGNNYIFHRLDTDCGGRVLRLSLRGQLGRRITYHIAAPELGSKATLLYASILDSMPALALMTVMIVLALVILMLYIALRKRIEMPQSTLYMSFFSLLFAAYIYCESDFCRLTAHSGYMVYSVTLLMLALLPIPLVGLYLERVDQRDRRILRLVICLCFLNFIVQFFLHVTGILNLRLMLPATHLVIILAIVLTVFGLLRAKQERKLARLDFLTVLPIVVGALTDILLLNLGRPSHNNSMFFQLGVMVFVLIQFISFIQGFLGLYRNTVEADLYRAMAYTDLLTGLGNRNSYEMTLAEMAGLPLTPQLGCLVADINDLKKLNDTCGHAAGDQSIILVGRVLTDLVPAGGKSFRTGGDEFVVLLQDTNAQAVQLLGRLIKAEVPKRCLENGLNVTLSVGAGCWEPADQTLQGFIQRVDSSMYRDKLSRQTT